MAPRCSLSATAVCLLIGIVAADVYFHNPRGSNDRLDESGRQRNNANRMFDSQNNDRGGYNVGNLYYYAGSALPIEWTNQHSCGGPNNNCEMIIQYMCSDRLRDGIVTKTIPDNRALCKNYDCNTDYTYGMHETYDQYMSCKYRSRNYGLFLADQQLSRWKKTAKYTRQNPKGTRRAYECPEERDYYPYWHPTDWKDIVIMTNNVSKCSYYQDESQNVKDRYACVVPQPYFSDSKRSSYPIPITQEDCEKFTWPMNDDNGVKAVWTRFPSHNIPKPDCRETMWSRDNHLGNGKNSINANTYEWTIPNLDEKHCALRIRYNVSTNDYDSWKTFADSNGSPTKVDIASLVGIKDADEAKNRGYLFKNNPVVQPFKGSDKFKLRLAINTAQFGRTFQDRSHKFSIRPRPTSVGNNNIYNLNVRGKRGNIVQVYPAVEYDFVPNVLTVSRNDYVHFQWTGSNTNPGNNDGQGQRGTDRSNVLLQKSQMYPEGTPFAIAGQKYGHWGNSYPMHLNRAQMLGFSPADIRTLAILDPGQLGGELSELDDAGTYFDLGARKITSQGTYYYMCTRNNNFSNRSQKGKLIVVANAQDEMQMGWSGGVLQLDSSGKSVVIAHDTLVEPRTLKFEEWPTSLAEEYVRGQGGSMNAGDSYASNYYVLFPAEDLTKVGKTMTLKMEVNTDSVSDVVLYHSYDTKTWSRMTDVSYDDNVATLQTTKGGFYVARKETKYGLIAGIVVACLILIIVVIGTTVYCRKKPERWGNFKRKTRNVKRTFKSTI